MAVSPTKLEEIARLLEQGRLAQAEAELSKLARISPGDANVAGLQVMVFARSGRTEQALFAAERRAALLPGDFAAQAAPVDLLLGAGRKAEALDRARRLFERDKSGSRGALVYASVLLHSGRLGEANRLIQEVESRGVRSSDLSGTRASALLGMGHAAEAVGVLEQILAREPGHPSALGLLAMTLNYVPGVDPARQFEIHRAYGDAMKRFSAPGAGRGTISAGEMTVGLLSSDLHEHSVARFVEPIARYAAQAGVRIVLISMGTYSDATSKRLAQLAKWHDLRPVGAARLAQIVREEKIGVLVELGGHTTNSPLPLLIPRVAPVQGTAIGYPNTTGLGTVDFRLVDSITDPPGASDGRATERLLRLDPCFLCFQPPEDAPDPGALPAASGGGVTFGSFNALSKVSDELLADWAELLRRVPGSRFVIKAPALEDEPTRRDLLSRAERAGLPGDRLELIGRKATMREHLACYQAIDIAVDTYPYHGTTTTCEALWMGVPVLTREGDRHASRVGVSLLRAVGAPEWIARDREELFALGASLAGDLVALAKIRAELRERVRRSVLCDGLAYAHRWAGAIRGFAAGAP
ncbi:MAG: hypothetical protein U0573_03435 [Phycisphaerales bacterium]|nr:glycosyltransferase [Planctomycetota bacterium]